MSQTATEASSALPIPGTTAMKKSQASGKPGQTCRTSSAASGPTIAPQVSMARWNPNARPRSSAAVESEMSASRAEVRIDLPTRSLVRPANKSGHPPRNAANPMTGLLIAEME